MPYVIRVLAVATAGEEQEVHQYLKHGDVDAFGGRGYAEMTTDPSAALQFGSFADAHEFWSRQSSVLLLRPDGKPNRPLTAFTVEIMETP